MTASQSHLKAKRPAPSTDGTDEAQRALLRRARAGDREALEQLYRRHHPGIVRYMRQRTGDEQLAADLASDVFVRVLEAVARGDAWRSSFTGWLYQIAHHRLVDHLRRTGRRRECALPDGASDGGRGALDERVEGALLADDVRAAVENLKPEQALILRLRFDLDLTHAEVARWTGKNPGAVKVAQFRALRRVQQRLLEGAHCDSLAS